MSELLALSLKRKSNWKRTAGSILDEMKNKSGKLTVHIPGLVFLIQDISIEMDAFHGMILAVVHSVSHESVPE